MKLIVDPGSEDKLVDLYMDSWMKEYKDEKLLGSENIRLNLSLH